MKRSFGSRKTATLSASVNHQLSMYALAAGATGVGLLAAAQPAEAKIVYTHVHERLVWDKAFPIDFNHDGKIDFYLNLRNDRGDGSNVEKLWACHRFIHESTQGDICTSSRSASNSLNAIRVLPSNGAAALRAGAKIQNGNRFRDKVIVPLGTVVYRTVSTTTTTGLKWFGAWVNGGKGVKTRYLGVKFKINGRFHFGWARLTVTTQAKSFAATLTGFAYETIPGKAITAGQTKGPDDISVETPTASLTAPTPEPATLGMLALGAPALSIWRREKSIRQNTAPALR